MSYRQLRNFSEYMKTLGYHRIISLENFRTPNFELVADALYWLCERYDPSAEISDDISTEKARVDFLKAIAQTMHTKARIKLNIKALYRADGFAVRELLKIAQVLHKSLLNSAGTMDSKDEKSIRVSEPNLQTKLDELKAARNMANDIVEMGSKLYGLLRQEKELKKSREKAIQFVDSISMNLESNAAREAVERSIREQITSITDNVNQLDRMCTDLKKDQKSLQTKIERKQTDLERAEKRLRSLKKVRPAFMEEYERLETELKMVYESYLERFRNLNYLEAELEKYYEAEREKQRDADRLLRRKQKRIKQEEMRVLRGEGGDLEEGDADEDEEDDLDRDVNLSKTTKAKRRSAGKNRGTANIVGSMDGGDSDEDEDSSDSAGFGGENEMGGHLSGDSDLTDGSGDGSHQFDDEDEDEGFTDDDLQNSGDGFGDEDEDDDGLDDDDF